MQQLVSLLEQYGLSFVFLHVLAEQAGVPLPAYPTLIVAGALVAHANYTVFRIAARSGRSVDACGLRVVSRRLAVRAPRAANALPHARSRDTARAIGP
jgi:hypothetical protein